MSSRIDKLYIARGWLGVSDSDNPPSDNRPNSSRRIHRWFYRPSQFGENTELYTPEAGKAGKGFAPLIIGSIVRPLGNDSFPGYEIKRKLSHGSYATVWLARNLSTSLLVSLRVVVSGLKRAEKEIMILNHLFHGGDSSPFVLRLLDSFYYPSVNGKHRVLVTEPHGPSITTMKEWVSEWGLLPKDVALRLAWQLPQAIAYIHERGIVHGDLHSNNIVFQSPGMQHWSDDEIERMLEEPLFDELKLANPQPGQSKSDIPINAPAVIYDRAQPTQQFIDNCLDHSTLCVVDFGEAFFSSDAPKTICTASYVAAPEVLEGLVLGPSVDVWAMACTQFDILGDHHLFQPLQGRHDHALEDMMRANWDFAEKLCELTYPDCEYPRQAAKETVTLWKQCLSREPVERPAAVDVVGAMKPDWFNKDEKRCHCQWPPGGTMSYITAGTAVVGMAVWAYGKWPWRH